MLWTVTNSRSELPVPRHGLQALRTRPADLKDPDKWEGPYLTKDIPLDPWNKPYQYACPGKHNSDKFDVWTIGPDNQVIGNWTKENKE